MQIETSFGRLAITEDPFSVIERTVRFRQESESFVRDTDLGKAQFDLNFTLDEEDGVTQVYVSVRSGTPEFGTAVAETPGFKRDGMRIGYVCHVHLDPARGTRRGDVRASVQNLDETRRILGSIIPDLKAPHIQEEVAQAVAKAVDALLSDEPGIAARFEAACLTYARQELDKEIRRDWEELSKKVSLRDRCRQRAVQSANDALGKDGGDDMVEIKAVGDSQDCAWLWAYEQNLPHDSEWDEVVATGVGMLNINLPSDSGGWIDIDLVDGRSVSIALSGKDIRLSGKVVGQEEAIRQVERAGVVLETVSLIEGKEEGE